VKFVIIGTKDTKHQFLCNVEGSKGLVQLTEVLAESHPELLEVKAKTIDFWALPTELDIVICNYNTATLLRNCLRTVFAAKTNFPFRVIVVDNGSTDASTAMVQREFSPYHPNLFLIHSAENIGFSAGNNLALRRICPLPEGAVYNPDYIGGKAQASYVLLLNPDTEVPPDAFQKMYDFMQITPQAGVVGAKLIKANGELDWACRRSFPTPEVSLYRMLGLSKLFPKHPQFARYNLTFLDLDTLYEVDSVCGAFMWMRGAALEQVGILDEAFFMYGEDLDWALRFKKQGWKVFYNPVTTVLHLKGESSKQRSTGAILNFYQAMDVFYKKHYAKETLFLLNWLILAGIWGKAAIALMLNATKPQEKRRVSKQ
jgi:N-acetylglucosaminyl-diphospho-decaprenol L-rhamnosyltransferase